MNQIYIFDILSLKSNQVLLFFTFAKHTAVIQILVILYQPIRTKRCWDASKRLAHRKFESVVKGYTESPL